MFRITYNKTISDTWRTKKTVDNTKQRRVYRWGISWAYASPWKVEKRITIHESEEILVELCTPTSEQQPPFEIDDMWDEEVFLQPHIEYNGLLSIVGDQQELLAIMMQERLPTVSLPAQSVQSQPSTKSVTRHATKYLTKSKCLIED